MKYRDFYIHYNKEYGFLVSRKHHKIACDEFIITNGTIDTAYNSWQSSLEECQIAIQNWYDLNTDRELIRLESAVRYAQSRVDNLKKQREG